MRDPGLAPERTLLSWQRTALAIVFSALLLARLTVHRIGPIAVVVIGIAVVMALWVYSESIRRSRRNVQKITTGGKATLAIMACMVLVGLVELLALAAG